MENVADIYPLTPTQEGMLFHATAEPGSGVYVEQYSCVITGPLRVKLLQEAWQEAMERHPALRTVFLWEDLDEPLQIVREVVKLAWDRRDWQDVPSDVQGEHWETFLADDRARGFTPAQAPLMRMTLLQTAADKHRFVWTFHHLLLDGWSAVNVLDEVWRDYAARCAGEETSLDAPRPFRDYVTWHRSRDRAGEQSYWTEYLRDFRRSTPLHIDQEFYNKTGRSERHLTLSPEETGVLRAFAQQHRLTLNTLVQGAWALLLSRYSGMDDVVYGTTVAGRPAALQGVEAMVGSFINTVPMRVVSDPAATPASWLKTVQSTLLEVRAHAETPLSQIQKWSAVGGGRPLFDSLLVFESHPKQQDRLTETTGLHVQEATFRGQSNYPLALLVHPTAGLHATAVYDAARFSDLRIERLLGHLTVILMGLTDPATSSLQDCPLLTADERRALLAGPRTSPLTGTSSQQDNNRHDDQRNDQRQDSFWDVAAIHHLISRAAAESPDALAVYFEAGVALTYGELETQAESVARSLAARGVAPGDFVGLFVERSPAMIIGMVGILKSGAAYVPLDPSYPVDRLRYMLDDAAAACVVTTRDKAADAPGVTPTGGETVSEKPILVEPGSSEPGSVDAMDREPTSGEPVRGEPVGSDPPLFYLEDLLCSHASGLPAAEVDVAADPERPAYLIYTSGSTGTPKGVVVTHANLIFSTRARHAYYDAAPACFLLVSPFGFDSSVAGLFWTLTSGGALVLPHPGEERDMQRLGELIDEHRVSHTLCVPALYALLLEYVSAEKLASLQTVIVAGEACPPALPAEHFKQLPDTALFNEYGPTEATVWATVHAVEAEGSYPSVPIGRAIPGAVTYVLDAHHRLVPPGVPGELYIGGPGVTTGYLNRPDTTAEHFIPAPFETGEHDTPLRLYRTGDRVRAHEDGVLEFLGRIDHQVKVQGYRVEPGEIETTLMQHDAVLEALVVAAPQHAIPSAGESRPADHAPAMPSRTRLIAYVVAQEHRMPTPSELRSFLTTRLPDHMIPVGFVALDSLPRTSNGKVDREALPTPEPKAVPDGSFVAPRTPTEEMLAAIWTSVLGMERIGVHDNYFEMGGDSILSIQIVAKARQADLRLTPHQLFQHPTIAELAAVASPVTTRVKHGSTAGLVPLTPIQHWFFDQSLSAPHHWNQTLWLSAPDSLTSDLLEKAVQHVAAHHDTLRLRFKQKEDTWQQFYAETKMPIAVSHRDLSSLSPDAQQSALASETERLQGSVSLHEGPLARVALFHRGGSDHDRILIIIHHLLVDPISWHILLEDLETAFNQLAQHHPVRLPRKTSPFNDWAEALATHAQSDQLRDEASYWLALADQPTPPLPVDRSGIFTEASAHVLSMSLSVAETHALQHDALPTYNLKTEDVLLAALVQSLSEWTGSSSLYLGLERHGRRELNESLDLSRTVGWFASFFPVTLTLHGNEDTGEILKSIKEQLRQIPHDGIGYGALRYLNPDDSVSEKLSTLSRPDVLFNYTGAGQADVLAPPGAAFKPVRPLALSSAPQNERPYLLGINAYVAAEQLTLQWAYSTNTYLPGTIERVAKRYMGALRNLIDHCLSPEAGGYTPSDFPEVDLSQNELDTFLDNIL